MTTFERPPRAQRTPASEINFIVDYVLALHAVWAKVPTESRVDHRAEFFAKHIEPILQGLAAPGDERLKAIARMPGEIPAINFTMLACAYAADAARALTSGEPEHLAWTYLSDARHWLGYVEGLGEAVTNPKPLRQRTGSTGGKVGSKTRASNRDQREKLLREWLETKLSELEHVQTVLLDAADKGAPGGAAASSSAMSKSIAKFVIDWRAKGLWKGK